MYDILCICSILHHLEEIEFHRINMQMTFMMANILVENNHCRWHHRI